MTQCSIGSACVVVAPPSFDQNVGFSQCLENFAIDQFMSEPGIEAFTIAVFIQRSWGDERGFAPKVPMLARTLLAINSAPLSGLMNSVDLRRIKRPV